VQATLPFFGANQIEKYCKVICEDLWDPQKNDEIFGRAMQAVYDVSGGSADRDKIHTLTFTDRLIKHCASITGTPPAF
jgi:hypothetical protein